MIRQIIKYISMKILIFSAVMMLVAASSFAQSDSKPSVRISDIMIQPGMQNFNDFSLNKNDFLKLAPGSLWLQTDFSDYAISRSTGEYTGVFGVTVGLKFLDKEKNAYKTNPVLRLGIFDARTSPDGVMYFKSESFRYDTLTSSATGNQYFVDSVFNSEYEMQYSTEHIGLTASLQFSTNPENRFSFYAGAGIVAAFSVSNSTKLTKIEFGNFSSDDVYYTRPVYNNSDYDYESTYISNKTSTLLSMGIPLGLDFRVARAHPFWSQIHLVYEFRPSLTMTTIPELKTYTSTGFCNTLGFKVSW